MRYSKPSYLNYLLHKTDLYRLSFFTVIALAWATIAWAFDWPRLLAATVATYLLFIVLYACASFIQWKRYVK